MARPIKVFFDGGCRPNPGTMEIAVVVAGRAHVRRDVGHGTSLDSEWLALIEALRIAQTLGTPDYVLLGDAAAVIGPALGRVKCRGPALLHLQTLKELAGSCGMPRIRKVKRAQNLAGIALAGLHER